MVVPVGPEIERGRGGGETFLGAGTQRRASERRCIIIFAVQNLDSLSILPLAP